MIPYEYPDIFTGTAVQKELLITDGTVTVTDDEYTVTDDTITFETGDFELESFELSQSLMSEMQFTYGCCETGKVRFIVRKHYVNSIIGVELKVYIIPDHDASKMLQLGVFKVNEDKQSDNYNVHNITAYDAMYDILNEDVTDWYNDILEDETSSVTLATFRTSFISFFGLTTESASVPLYNDDLVLKRTIEKDQISGAEIIKAICELNGCFGIINNVGQFRYKGLPPSIIHDASTLELDVPDYMDIQFEDTSFKPIKAVKIVNDGVSVTSSQTATGNYNTYTIAYNPLIANYSQADLQSLANDLCDLFYNHSYLPCTINAIGNPVHEVGDCLEVSTKYGYSILTYIFERTLKGIQALRDTYRSNGVEYLTESLNKQSTQTKAVQSQVSQMAQTYANSDTDFVETIRNIGFRLLDEPSDVSVEYEDEPAPIKDKWIVKEWQGLTSFSGIDVWSDGENIYYSNGSPHYVLNKATSTWESKSWSGMSYFRGYFMWQYGDATYYSYSSEQRTLNKNTDTWEQKTWGSAVTPNYGYEIWFDGSDYFFSEGNTQYELDDTNDTWSNKQWANNKIPYIGSYVWSDGEHLYYSAGNNAQYIYDPNTGTWSNKSWNGFRPNGEYIWTDGVNIYYSYDTNQYVLDRSTDTWIEQEWKGSLYPAYGTRIWTDGTDIYYSDGSTQYVLVASEE